MGSNGNRDNVYRDFDQGYGSIPLNRQDSANNLGDSLFQRQPTHKDQNNCDFYKLIKPKNQKIEESVIEGETIEDPTPKVSNQNNSENANDRISAETSSNQKPILENTQVQTHPKPQVQTQPKPQVQTQPKQNTTPEKVIKQKHANKVVIVDYQKIAQNEPTKKLILEKVIQENTKIPEKQLLTSEPFPEMPQTNFSPYVAISDNMYEGDDDVSDSCKKESLVRRFSEKLLQSKAINQDGVLMTKWPDHSIYVECLNCNELGNTEMKKTIQKDKVKWLVVGFPIAPCIYFGGCFHEVQHYCIKCNAYFGSNCD